MSRRTKIVLFAVVATLVTAMLAPTASAAPRDAHYEVTLTNLSDGQPLSPPVAATHQKSVRLFQVGRPASGAIEAIAEDGNQAPAVMALGDARHVTDAVDVGRPLPRSGETFMGLTDTVTFNITAAPGDFFSLATMLICTNDGFTGIDAAKLPVSGSATFYLGAYDAGTEANSQVSEDIVDPCSALGPVALDGDPNGNVNAEPDVRGVITMHGGIHDRGDLSSSVHGWDGPIAMLTITRVG